MLKICLGEREDGGYVLRYKVDGKDAYVPMPKNVWVELVQFIREFDFPAGG